jgi:hypothetical protein
MNPNAIASKYYILKGYVVNLFLRYGCVKNGMAF